MLNTILMECVTPYRPKHYEQHLIEILLDISKIYTPATSDKNPAFSARDFSWAVHHRVGQNSWSQYWFSATKYNFGKVQTAISFQIKHQRGFYAHQ